MTVPAAQLGTIEGGLGVYIHTCMCLYVVYICNVLVC